MDSEKNVDIKKMMNGLVQIWGMLERKGRLELRLRPDGVWMIVVYTISPNYQLLARGDSPEQCLLVASNYLRPLLEKRAQVMKSELAWMETVLGAKNG